jgi:DNA-nicking Smr family endonuclease
MPIERSLTLKIIIHGKSEEEANTLKTHARLWVQDMTGEERPVLEIAEASRESVENGGA